MQFQRWFIGQLRRISYKWPPAYAALKKAKRGVDQYECAKCKKSFKRKEVQRDHIQSVIDSSDGFLTWDIYISRLFCSVDGYQILCKVCHKKKTLKENKKR